MKAILEFNLDDPDDTKAHLRCVKATDMAIVLFEIIYNTRKEIENGNHKDPVDVLYQRFHDILEENGIIIDELIS